MGDAASGNRLVSVDLLRGLAILLVLGVHWNLSELSATGTSLLDIIVRSVATPGSEDVEAGHVARIAFTEPANQRLRQRFLQREAPAA